MSAEAHRRRQVDPASCCNPSAKSARAAGLCATSALAWRFTVLRRLVPVASRGRAIFALLLLAAAVVGCGVLSGRTYRMDTRDMAPTIPRGTELSLQSETGIHRGDIVAVSPPAFLKLHGVNYLLRRIVGLPGETISASDGHIAINARALAEPYLARGTITPKFNAVRIPKAHYFVLGDNRRTALDSRRFGPIPRGKIVGREPSEVPARTAACTPRRTRQNGRGDGL